MHNKPLVHKKWRPSLGLILVSVLLAVLALPIAILLGFRARAGELYQIQTVEIGALGLSAILTILIAYVLTRTISQPTLALVKRAREIGHGNRAAIRPLNAYGTREIASLTQSVLDLATRLVDRTDYVQTFAAHVSHELKSPLTSIKGAAELLRDETEDTPIAPDKRDQFLQNIILDAERLDLLIKRLRELANADIPQTTGTTSLTQIAKHLAAHFPSLSIGCRSNSAHQVPLSTETADIIFGHLATNAAEHGGRNLELDLQIDRTNIVIRVCDDGSGIPQGNADLIFQPLFSTRKDQGGTGMGLEIVKAMLATNNGSIRAINSDNGATFEITLPTAPRTN